ncbi:glycosyltransferase family 4 protein [Williamsia herbipolensis]|uniref:glycosyltransferase family 4 protein n=1 Tax=Williamsia herbipolensis TaxID=1603258 RepID=UPI0006976BA0|nr:glycosyltransferase family 4 protein [Williamsia herbipolensis]
MRILLIHNFYQLYAGEDNAFEETVAALDDLGHETLVLTKHNDEIPSSRLRRMVFAPYLLVSIYFNPASFVRVFRAARRFGPDVAIVQNVFPLLSPSVYVALRLARVPVMQRLLNYRVMCANGILFTEGSICERCLGGSFTNAVRYRCYRGSRIQSALLASSLRLWKVLGLWRWGAQTYLPSTDFLIEKLRPWLAAHPRITVRVRAPKPPEDVPAPNGRGRTVLFVGRIVREKGIFTLLDAAGRLQVSDPDVTFRIVGVGDHLDEAQAYAQRLRLANVVWLGSRYGEQVWDELRSAGIFVVPSEWYDNLPTVVSQAMFSRAPIVASRINGIPEVVSDRENGLLFVPGDADDLAEKLREVLTDPEGAQARADNAFATAQREFGAQSFRDRLAAVIDAQPWAS